MNLYEMFFRTLRIRRQGGLTLLELILSITITATLVGIIAPLLVYSVDIFQFVTVRKDALQANRFAIHRLGKELRHIPAADSIKAASPASFEFVNRNGQRMMIELNKNILTLNKHPLLTRVKLFKLTYFDSKSNALPFPIKTPQKIWRVRYEIVLRQNSHTIRFSNEIKPRNF